MLIKGIDMSARFNGKNYFPFLVGALYSTGSMLQIPISMTNWKPIWAFLAPFIVLAGIVSLFRSQQNGYMSFVKICCSVILTNIVLSTIVAYPRLKEEDLYKLTQAFAFSFTSIALFAWLVLAPDGIATTASRGMIVGLLVCLSAGLLETFQLYRFPGSADCIVNPEILRADLVEWAAKLPCAGWGNPNGFSACMVILSIAALARGRFWLIIYFACAFAIVKSEARLCLIALLLGSFLLFYLRLAKRRSKLYAVTMVALALCCVITFYWHTEKTSYESIDPVYAVKDELGRDDSRINLTKLAFQAFSNSPFFGSGPGFMYKAMESVDKSTSLNPVLDAHNQFATIFVELGLIAGALMLILGATLCLRSISLVFRCSSASPVYNSTESATGAVWGCILPILWLCQSNSFGLWPLWMAFAIALRASWTRCS